MKRLVSIVLVPVILAVVWVYFENKVRECRVPQDGVVSFDFNGQKYAISGMEMLIFATERADRDHIVEIPQGQKHDFNFAITSTVKKQSEVKYNDQNWLAKNWYDVSISWYQPPIQNPELLTGKIDVRGNSTLYISFVLPNRGLITGNPLKKDTWVRLDSISQGRAKGRFGGTFTLNSIQIENGSFDIPVEKLYKYK